MGGIPDNRRIVDAFVAMEGLIVCQIRRKEASIVLVILVFGLKKISTSHLS